MANPESAIREPKPRPSHIDVRGNKESEVKKMEAHFAAQKKVRVRIRPEDGEQWVEVNGYSFLIQPGEWVRVPEQIYDMLVEKGVA